MKATDHQISCPLFGGTRLATACITQDRYKRCRRTCPSLSKHLETNPDLPQQAVKQAREQTGFFELVPMKFAGKGVVNPMLKCPECSYFVAKTPRGLKIHRNRQHKRKGSK